MAGYGFLDRQPEAEYLGWQLAEVSAYFYPDATLDGLCLATDLMGWYFTPFDNQFDGPLGRDPQGAARLCGLFTEILSGAHPADDPVAHSFADIWRRLQQGMSPMWRFRAAYNWAEYLAVYVTEAQLRTGQLGAWHDTEHMWRRRRSISSGPVNDLAERAGGFEVPPLAWHSQTLHDMRAVAADVVSLSNDTASAEKEEQAADPGSNMLLMLQNTGMTKPQAITEVQHRTNALVQRFLDLEQRAHRLARAFLEHDRTAIQRHVLALQDFMRGNDHWEHTSSRYAGAVKLLGVADLLK